MKIGFLVKQPEEEWFRLEWRFADEAAKQYGFSLMKIGAVDGDLAVAPNLVEIEHDIDFDGMAGSTFDFGTDVAACQSGTPGVRIYGFIVAQNNRGYPCIPMSVVLQGGGHGGRVVLNYTDVEPPIAPVTSSTPRFQRSLICGVPESVLPNISNQPSTYCFDRYAASWRNVWTVR